MRDLHCGMPMDETRSAPEAAGHYGATSPEFARKVRRTLRSPAVRENFNVIGVEEVRHFVGIDTDGRPGSTPSASASEEILSQLRIGTVTAVVTNAITT